MSSIPGVSFCRSNLGREPFARTSIVCGHKIGKGAVCDADIRRVTVCQPKGGRETVCRFVDAR